MGIGPVPATQKVLPLAGLTIDQMDVIELNEAFNSQDFATLRALGVVGVPGCRARWVCCRPRVSWV